MKTLRLFKAVTVFITVVLLFNSCAPTDDNELNPITKFVGTWSVNDQAARLNYEVTIDYNPLNSAEVVLKNFADLGNSAVGLVVGNTIVIDNQVLSGDNSVSGSGSYINENKLSFNYQLDNGIDTESRVAIFSK